MDLCLAAEHRPESRVTKWWWEQDGLMDRWVEHMEGGGGYRRERDRDGLSWWEDNVAQVNLGKEPNDYIAYALGLEHHHPIMSTLVDTGGRLEREVDSFIWNQTIITYFPCIKHERDILMHLSAQS